MPEEPPNAPERNELPTTIEITDFRQFEHHLGAVCAGIYAQEYITQYQGTHSDGMPNGPDGELVAWLGDQLRDMCAKLICVLPKDLHLDKDQLFDLASLANDEYPPPQYLQNITPLVGCTALMKVYHYLKDLPDGLLDDDEESEQSMENISPMEVLRCGAGVVALFVIEEYGLADTEVEAAYHAFGAKALEIFWSGK